MFAAAAKRALGNVAKGGHADSAQLNLALSVAKDGGGSCVSVVSRIAPGLMSAASTSAFAPLLARRALHVAAGARAAQLAAGTSIYCYPRHGTPTNQHNKTRVRKPCCYPRHIACSSNIQLDKTRGVADACMLICQTLPGDALLRCAARPGGRGLHSSTSQLNLSALYEIRGAHRGVYS